MEKTNNMLHKPISIIRDDLMNKIAQAINESGLSYFVLEYIFKDLLTEIHNGAARQAQQEHAEYQKQLKNQAEKAVNHLRDTE